jgi:hypothetical protein
MIYQIGYTLKNKYFLKNNVCVLHICKHLA